MIQLNETSNRLGPSLTHEASARAQVLRSQGRDIISFGLGEPDFDTPQHIKDAAIRAIQQGMTKYTAIGGILPLRQAIAAKINRDQGAEYSPDEVVVTNGGKQAIAGACAVLLGPGDEVIIPAPYWTSYPDLIKLCGATPVTVQLSAQDEYILTPSALERAWTPKTKMIIINSPSNPSGACYSEKSLRVLARTISSLKNAAEIIVLSDEVYEAITYDGFKHTSMFTVAPELRENIILVNAFSKAYAMTGWRVGYALGPKHVIQAITNYQGQITANVCSIAQHAALAAYEDNDAFPKMMRQEFEKRREIVWEEIQRISDFELAVKPQGAFYAFPKVRRLFGKKDKDLLINSAADFTLYLLEEHGLAVVQGEAFGDPESIRLSFALSADKLREGFRRLRNAVEKLGSK